MAQGGLYDHLGGGFARYSTDRKWLIPRKYSLYCQISLFLSSHLTPDFPLLSNRLREDAVRQRSAGSSLLGGL